MARGTVRAEISGMCLGSRRPGRRGSGGGGLDAGGSLTTSTGVVTGARRHRGWSAGPLVRCREHRCEQCGERPGGNSGSPWGDTVRMHWRLWRMTRPAAIQGGYTGTCGGERGSPLLEKSRGALPRSTY